MVVNLDNEVVGWDWVTVGFGPPASRSTVEPKQAASVCSDRPVSRELSKPGPWGDHQITATTLGADIPSFRPHVLRGSVKVPTTIQFAHLRRGRSLLLDFDGAT